MGLRFLLYIAQLYELSMDKKAMYKTKKMSIANPEFYMIYNGKDDYPEKSIVKLSDLFKVQGNGGNNLELIVTVYNMNKGHNKKIMGRSKTLNEYAGFVAKVREQTEVGLELTEALKKAVENCVKEGILREFLQKYGGDIVNILYREFNMDEAKEVWAEEAREEIAEKMLSDNEPMSKIIKYTGLTEENILDLKQNLKI